MERSVIDNMAPIEADVKIILDEHDDRLKRLEIESAKTNEILKNLKEGQDKLEEKMDSGMSRLENIMLNNNNTMLSTMQQLLISKENNETQKEINKENNKSQEKINKFINLKDLIKQFLITGSALLTALWAGDKLLK